MGHSLDFFNQKDFEFLKKFSGIKKDLSEEQHVSTYNYLRDTTYPKVEYWIAKTQEKIFPDGDYDILKRPTFQFNYFMDYQWGKIYPKKKSDRRLAYTLAILDTTQFEIKIDTVALDEQDSIRKSFLEYCQKSKNPPEYFRVEVNEVGDWDHLINLTVKNIENLKNHYNILYDRLFGEKDSNVSDEQITKTDEISKESSSDQGSKIKNQDFISKLHSDTDSGEDKLDIESEVESLAKVLAYKETDLPLSIGLFGNWGSGKSFFMKKLQKSVTNFSAKENSKYYNRIAQIEFNAWHYAESNLWASLVYNIFANLEEDSSKDEVMILLNSLDEKLKIKKNELEKLKKESELFVSKFNEIKQKIKDEGVSRSKVIELVFKEFCQPKNKQNNEEIDRWAKIAGLIPKEQKEIQLKEIYEKSKEHEQLSILNKLKRRVKGYSFLILCISGVIGVIYLLPYIYNICKETYLIKIFIETYPSLKELFEAILKMFLFIPFPPVVYKIWESWSNKNIFWSTPILEKMRNTFLEFEKKIVKEEEEITNRLKKLDDEKNYYDNLIKEKTIQIDDIEKEKENTTYEKALSSFIKNRTESNDYVKHLGLPSIIRKDFKTLSNLIQKFNNEKENAENKGIPINRIILYIDDLDRCPYEKVVKVLEAVHLLLAFKAFIVVVAVDERWVSNALKVKYKDFFNANSKSATPQDYLEKIFQIPYWIKPMNSKGRIDLLNHLMPLKVDPDNNKDNPEAKLGDTNETIAYSNPLMDNFIEGITSYNKSPEIQEVEEVELSFTKEEKNFIKEVEGLMGSTPRDIKRFVNIYLLIKAGAEEKLESNKIYDLVKMRNIKGNLFNYECIMFLLAIVIGMPKSGKYFFQYLRNVNNNIPFLDGFHEFIEKQPKLDGDKISIQNEIANFTNWMNRNANRIIEEQNFDQLQYWDSFVSRYSFDAEVHKSES